MWTGNTNVASKQPSTIKPTPIIIRMFACPPAAHVPIHLSVRSPPPNQLDQQCHVKSWGEHSKSSYRGGGKKQYIEWSQGQRCQILTSEIVQLDSWNSTMLRTIKQLGCRISWLHLCNERNRIKLQKRQLWQKVLLSCHWRDTSTSFNVADVLNRHLFFHLQN
jgi:hypothetical protein